jgi:hypothetical protein
MLLFSFKWVLVNYNAAVLLGLVFIQMLVLLLKHLKLTGRQGKVWEGSG